jgi:hypothetical protein
VAREQRANRKSAIASGKYDATMDVTCEDE